MYSTEEDFPTACNHNDLVFVSVKLAHFPSDGVTRDVAGPPVESADTVDRSSGSGIRTGFADQECNSATQFVTVRLASRQILATLRFGRRASSADRDAAYSIVDSLRDR